MPKRIHDPEEILEAFLAEFRGLYGDGLRSVVLYGSAARGDFEPGRSDVNFLVVLDSDAILDLEKAFDAVREWSKRGVAVPLFLTDRYIRGALDSFPIEFLDMKSGYRVIHGEDPFAGLRIDRAAVRLQAERDARGHLLRLRQAYLESGGDAGSLRDLVSDSLPGFRALFRALLWYLTGEMVESREEVTRRVCDHFNLRFDLFEQLEEVRAGVKRRKADMLTLADDYLAEIRKLVLGIDEMEGLHAEGSDG